MKYVNTILIVDDDPGARDTLEALLLNEGYHLAFASCGEEALKKAKELTPSLILLDIMMPEMDGFEVCQRLRSLPLLAEVPVIMVTALDDRDSHLQGIRAGADDFISKPFDREVLRARVRTIVRLNRYRRLHMERARFEWVVQQADDGYVIVNERDEILYANSHACLFLGLPLPQADLSTVESSKVSPEKFLELARKHYLLEPQEAWSLWPDLPDETSSPMRYLVKPESPASAAFWLQVDILELPAEPDMGRVVRLCDVTAQVKAAHNRRGFHTIICHKLRTPLVGILGSLEFLAHHSLTLSSSEITEFADIAFTSARRLHSEIEDILQYLKAPGVVKSGTRCKISQVASIVDQISQELKLESIMVTVQKELNDTCLFLSQRAVELILWEILENSIKFHPAQTPAVEVDMFRFSEQEVRVLVRDDGQILSPKQLSQLWIPYYQGEKYSTGEATGMGLGLAMVAVLVWEAGGTCRAYNREDHVGVVIELNLPLVDCEEDSL